MKKKIEQLLDWLTFNICYARFYFQAQYNSPEFFDQTDKFSKRLISISAQLFILVSAIQTLDLQNFVYYEMPDLFFRLDRSLKFILLTCFACGWLIKFMTMIADRLTGYGWIPRAHQITADELSHYFPFYGELFVGHEITPFQIARTLLERGLMSVTVISKENMSDKRTSVFCGLFVVQFLSNSGRDRLINGVIDGRNFDTSDLVSAHEEADGVYVGAMGGFSRVDKGLVVAELYRYLQTFDGWLLMGRPITADGKRLARKNGWGPLQQDNGEPSEIWTNDVRQIQKANQQLPKH